MDYGHRHAGSRAASTEDRYVPKFYLDLLILVGRPLRPITKPPVEFFDNITVSFKHWRASYSCKHVHGLSFNIEHRTFRLATAATRESWFIVMHPIVNSPEPLVSRSERRKNREKAAEHSALEHRHAFFLASYIKEVFLIGDLLGEGIAPSWKLHGPQAQTITYAKWNTFQHAFMAGWSEYVRENTQDPFWTENQPAFHAYDYGANIEIEVSEQLHALRKETRLRPQDEESESESEGEARPSEGGSSVSGSDPDDEGTPSAAPTPYDYQDLFVNSVERLRSSLEGKYALENMETVSYALAVNIHQAEGTISPGQEGPLSRCLLANRNTVLREYQRPGDFTFFPLAFHPAYGNFSSAQPPAFLRDNLLATLQDNISYQHHSASVLTCGHFQAYSNIKRSIRHGPHDLLATQGIATAALTLPDRDGTLNRRVALKRQRLLESLRGEHTPHNPESSRPFFRERDQIFTAMDAEEYPFRMEQVLSVQVSKLADERRSFATVLQPIFQLIRYFVVEEETYLHLFQSFEPEVFPGVLRSFANVFAHAMDDLYTRFAAAGSQGLPFALAESVAALDRLGSYCFTGFSASLMGSVLKPLGTIESIEQGGWPFLDPAMLDARGAGAIDLARWPRTDKGRPIMMHIASIGYHYGADVAAYCHSEVWFREVGGLAVQGPSSAAKFLDEVLEEMWKPQMIAFVTHQFYRALNKGTRGYALSEGQGALQAREEARERVRRWAEGENPFSAECVRPCEVRVRC